MSLAPQRQQGASAPSERRSITKGAFRSPLFASAPLARRSAVGAGVLKRGDSFS